MAPTLFVWVLGFFLLGNCYAVNTRIAGGKPSSVLDHPSVAQVESYNVFTNVWVQTCACAILTKRWVLSAAQCFDGSLYMPEYRRVRAGTSVRHTGGQVIYVKRAVNHPNFGPDSFEADMSVVELQKSFDYTPAVQQAMIAATGSILPDNTPVLVAGWGIVSEEGLASNELQEVTVLTANNRECREYYSSLSTPGVVTDNMICMGLSPDQGNICPGDQGGPVYYDGIVVGISSFGNGCSSEHYPGVSTAVAPHTEWIQSVVNSS